MFHADPTRADFVGSVCHFRRLSDPSFLFFVGIRQGPCSDLRARANLGALAPLLRVIL